MDEKRHGLHVAFARIGVIFVLLSRPWGRQLISWLWRKCSSSR